MPDVTPTPSDLALDLHDLLARAEYATAQLALLGLGSPPDMLADLLPVLRRAIVAATLPAGLACPEVERMIAEGCPHHQD